MKLSLSIIILFFSLHAFSETLNCSNADSSLKYSYFRTDGGAPIDPSTSLVLNDSVLISDEPFGAVIRAADFCRSGKAKIIEITRKDYYQTKLFVQEAHVTSLADKSSLFKGKIFCKEVTYFGPPRP